MEATKKFTKRGISTIQEFRGLLDTKYKSEWEYHNLRLVNIDEEITSRYGLNPSTGDIYDIEFVAGGITVFSCRSVGFFNDENWKLTSDEDKYNLFNFDNIDVVCGLFNELHHVSFRVDAECISEDEQLDGEVYRTYSVTFTYENWGA